MPRLLPRLMLAPLLSLSLLPGSPLRAESPVIDVYRDANCGCCTAWIDHLEEHGLQVNDQVVDDMTALKIKLGVPAELSSCHTGMINGQFVEGHVPAADVLKLSQQPDLLGVAVPRMPIGSPGMEMGDRLDPYAVIGLQQDGSTRVVNRYP